MTSVIRRFRFAWLIEFLACSVIVLGFYDLCRVFSRNGYLPAPFVFDVNDTFMDWFNTAYWAHRAGAYEVWNSIYAPLSFVFTLLMGDPRCYADGPFDARDCDMFGIVMILATYALAVVVSAVTFHRNDRPTWVSRTIGIALGGPLLFALERGNLIMIAYIFFVLLYGGYLKRRSSIAIAAAMIINLKSYLLLPILGLAAHRRWRLLELCGIATIGVYLVSLAWIGEGTLFQIMHDLQVWFQMRAGAIWDELLYTTTYKPYLLFDERQYPIRDFVPQRTVDIATAAIKIELVLSRGIALLALASSWFYPKAVPMHRIAIFALMQSFLVQNPGGYAITFVVFLVFMEREKTFATMLAITCCYLVSIPTDINLTVFYHYERAAWLSGRWVDSEYALPLGALIRPGLLLAVVWALAIDSLVAVHREIRRSQPQIGLRPVSAQFREKVAWT